MNLRDLYRLNVKALKVIQSNDPTPLYNELVAQLNQMRSAPTPELRTTIAETTAKIEKQNAQIDQELAAIPHVDFLETRANLRGRVGANATHRLKSILSSDPYFAADEVSKIVADIAKLLASLTETNANLSQYGIGADESEDEEPALISFELAGESDASTTAELSYKLGVIEKIVHAFSRLEGQPEAFAKLEIYSISKSSPVIIDLGSAISALHHQITLYMLANGITWGMNRYEQSQRIRVNHQKLKKQGMSNEDIETGFKKLEADAISRTNIERFVDEELLGSSKVSLTEEAGSREEIRQALIDAMRKLLTLIQKGATANVYLPKSTTVDDPETVEIVNEVASYTKEVAQLREKILTQEKEIKRLAASHADEPSDNANDADS